MHRIVGLDLSPEALRVVALESGFRGFTVLEARSAALGPVATAGHDGSGGTRSERIKAALEHLSLSLGDDAVAISLPSSQVATHLFTLPFVDLRRIEQVLPAEVEGAIPFEMNDVIWDHCVLSQAEGKSQVLVAVVQKSVLKATLDELRAAGVEPRTVTCAPVALAALEERKLLAQSGGADFALTESVLLVEAGPDRASATLIHAGSIELARALSAAPAASWNAAQNREEGAVDRLLTPLVRDLKLALRSRARPSLPPPARALLVGPLAELPEATRHLAALLEMSCEPLALDAVAQLPQSSPPSPEIALALALAVRAQHPRGHINFRKGEFAFTKDSSQARGQVLRVAIAAGVVMLLALVSGIARVAALSSQTAGYDDALCSTTKKVLGSCVKDYRMAVSQMSGGSSKAGGIPRASASEVLAEVLAHLPEASVPLLDDVDITTTTIRIKGVAESYGQVDQIVGALKADKCMGEIKQPRVEKLRDSTKISFSLDFPYTCSGEAGGA